MENQKWSIWAIIWFVLVILSQWVMFVLVEEFIQPENPEFQHALIFYGISGVIGTVLYLWLALKKSKIALYMIIALGVIHVLMRLAGDNGVLLSLLALLLPGITYLVAHKKVH